MCRLPHLLVGVWFCGLVDGWVFLLTFWNLTAYLKHLSPLQGYFFHVDSMDWLKLNCLHRSTAFTPQSNLPSISIFSLMVRSVCWHLGFETDILKCNARRKKTQSFISFRMHLFFSCRSSWDKHNRYIKECIYFSNACQHCRHKERKTTYSTWKTLAVASFFNLK